MKIFRKMVYTVTSCVLLLSFMCINASADTGDLDTRVEQEYNQNGCKLKEIANYTYDNNGNVISEEIITGEKEIKEQLKKDIIMETREESFENDSIYNNSDSLISPMSAGDLRVVKGWTGSYRVHLRTVQGGPGGTVGAAINESFSTTISSTTSVTNSIVTAGIGVSVQSSISVNQSYSNNVTSGKYGYVDVGVNRRDINFDVQKQGLFGGWSNVGSGHYDYVTGASFRYYES